MNGRLLVGGFVVCVAVFTVALIWFQEFAYYERQQGVGALTIDGAVVPVADYQGIDFVSSPLKLRGCLRIDPGAVAALRPAPEATPLNPPIWFRCYDAKALTRDLEAGRATAYAIGRDEPAGFDLMLVVYPDGRGYLWRQLAGGTGE